jgi:predicted dithiol-disulfide oxidoreductase (DUF899 family)
MKEEQTMPEHRVARREEWQEARRQLLEQEKQHLERARELTRQRQQLPWVPVEKQYTFATDDGPKTLAELFDGRSQLIAYHLMFGPDYEAACPGCTGLADHFDAGVIHLENRDVTLLAISRAPLEKLQAYKRRMGWSFPWVSSFGSDYAFDFGFAFTQEQMASPIERNFERVDVPAMLADPPDWLVEWSHAVGTDLEHGLAEGPGWNAFALSEGAVYQTYVRYAPGDLLGPYYYQLLDLTPNGRGDEVRVRRHDEYGDA